MAVRKKKVVKEVVKPVEQVPDVQKQRSIADMLDDEKVQGTLRFWADTINKKMSGNWFTVQQVAKKYFQSDLVRGQATLDAIVLGGFAHREVREGNIVKYKITLKPEHKIALLKLQLKELDKQSADILSEIERLEKQDSPPIAG